MITRQELNLRDYKLTGEQDINQGKLLIAINIVRTAYGKPMVVTSGVRSMADQMRINPSAPKSNHLQGLAVDIQDSDGALYRWCKGNESILVSAGLWCEDGTVGWVHFQCVSPKSGRRWFKP